MALESITHFLTIIIPLCSIVLFSVVIATYAFTIPGLYAISESCISFVKLNVTMKVISATYRPLQLVAVIHILRHRASRELHWSTQVSMFGFGIQGVPIGSLFQAAEIFSALFLGGRKNNDSSWKLVSDRWIGCFELILLAIVVILELRCKRGVPLIGGWIDSIIDPVEGNDVMEKGEMVEVKGEDEGTAI